MTTLVFFLLVFLVVGVFFLFFHLMLGKMIRPAKPEADKLTVYECGEPTIGSAWIQFDLRYYVVALLFVIFDVEVAFFFPWAVVFGTANTLAMDIPDAERQRLSRELVPASLRPVSPPNAAGAVKAGELVIDRSTARGLAWLTFWDILIFFGVLLVGFAYLWKRGDIDWVRSTAAERLEGAEPASALPDEKLLVGSGQNLGV
jgi:NADH-quinone oxidoreductase subunit A